MADSFWTTERGRRIVELAGPIEWDEGDDCLRLKRTPMSWWIQRWHNGEWVGDVMSPDDHVAACIIRDHLRRLLRNHTVDVCYDWYGEFTSFQPGGPTLSHGTGEDEVIAEAVERVAGEEEKR